MKARALKLLGLGVAGVMVITSVAVFADSGAKQGKRGGAGNGIGIKQQLTDEQLAGMKAEHLAKLKEKLDEQVAADAITQEKADEIYAKAESGDFKGMGKPEFKELTDEEKAAMKAERLSKLKEKLDEQVAAGAITQEKADEIYAKAESGEKTFNAAPKGKDRMDKCPKGNAPAGKSGRTSGVRAKADAKTTAL